MRKILSFLALTLLVSCMETYEKGPFECKSPVVGKEHQDAKTEITYHYGYSVMRGKWCMHTGPEDIPEKNLVYYEFLGDTLSKNSENLYDSAGTYLNIQYVKVYTIEKDDTIFSHNRIVNISK
jgi:hypothetical protein